MISNFIHIHPLDPLDVSYFTIMWRPVGSPWRTHDPRLRFSFPGWTQSLWTGPWTSALRTGAEFGKRPRHSLLANWLVVSQKECVFKFSVHFLGVQPYRREDCLRWRMMTNIFIWDMLQPPTSARALLSLNFWKLYSRRLPNLLIDSSTQNPAVVWSNLHAVLCDILFR